MQWLAENPTARRPKNYWAPFLAQLAVGFHERCAYQAQWTSDGTVDHYIPFQPNGRQLAYEWSNFRFCGARMNACKRDAGPESILDPLLVGDGWFQILYPSLQLRATDRIPAELRLLAESTIKRLRLIDHEPILRARSAWLDLYLRHNLDIEALRLKAPLIAEMVERESLQPYS